MRTNFLVAGFLFESICFSQSQVGTSATSQVTNDDLAKIQFDFASGTKVIFAAKDTSKPDTIAVMFCSVNSASLDEVLIHVDTGSDIRFSRDSRSQFSGSAGDSVLVFTVKLDWAKFENLCDFKIIRIRAGSRFYILDQSMRKTLDRFHQHFLDPQNVGPEDYDKAPEVLSKTEPIYPQPALRAGLEGTVVLKVWVNSQGEIHKIVVLKTDAEIFNQAAVDAAGKWTFAPAYLRGKPISVWVTIPFLFRLGEHSH
ncbi:MAG: energy transducer TonB [Bacteroidota bacterium]